MIPICILTMADEDDREFMTALYLDYKRLIYHTVMQIVRDPWAAEDLMQATVEKLIVRVDELRVKERTRLVNYIITTAKNGALNYLRGKKHEAGVSLDDQRETLDLSCDQDAIEQRLIREEDLEGLVRVWPMLDARSRYLLEERYVRERSFQEIAGDLGIKPDSARMALTRARRTVLQLIERQEREETRRRLQNGADK